MLTKGLIQVYTGNTQEFNFAPFGLALRAAGHGLSTLITSFLPHDMMEGEAETSNLLKPYLTIDHSAFKSGEPGLQSNKNHILDTFQRAGEATLSGRFDIVVLNDIHSILQRKIVAPDDLLAMMRQRAPNVELVLTGPMAPEKITDEADLVTEMVVSRSGKSAGFESVTVVTGDGKGKTTYCLGKAILSASLGVRCAMLQFIKSPQPYGEVKGAKMIRNLDIKTMGKGFLYPDDAAGKKKHLEAAQLAWKASLEEIRSQKYGLIILDEINVAMHLGLIEPDQVMEAVDQKPPDLRLILGGRNAPPQIMEAATTIIEMKEVRHPFRKGIKARKGIEF